MGREEQGEAPRVLIVDDEPLICDLLERILEGEGLELRTTSKGQEVPAIIKGQKYNLIISDLKMPGVNGMDLLQEIKRISPGTAVIIITGYGTVETAVEAMKHGAYDFIAKPFHEVEQVVNTVRRALAAQTAG